MLVLKLIVSPVQSKDWFVTVDQKDTYFHISILPEHRNILRFAFRGKAYQHRVLSFILWLNLKKGVLSLYDPSSWLRVPLLSCVAIAKPVGLTPLSWVGCSSQWPSSPWPLVWSSSLMAYTLPRNKGCTVFIALEYFLQELRGYHVLVWQHNSSLLHQPPGRNVFSPLFRQAQQIPLWVEDRLDSLRPVYFPGHAHLWEDILQRLRPGKRIWFARIKHACCL